MLGGFNDIKTCGKGLNKTYNCACNHVCAMMSNGEGNVLLSRCNALQKTCVDLIAFETFVVYSEPMDVKWHNKQCILGECTKCRVHKLPLYPQELTFNALVKWRSSGNEIVGVSKDGGPKKVLKVLYHDTHAINLVKYMKPKLKKFLIHNFINQWQDE